MKGYLNDSQIEYVLFHLGHHLELNDRIRDSFMFVKRGEDYSAHTDRIIFLLSDEQLNTEMIHTIGDIHVLFPVVKEKNSFASVNGNIIFSSDLLKSSFYLLSGYQELETGKTDFRGRYPLESSVQYRLGFVTRPLVNYYFEEIIKGIREFCDLHNIEFSRKTCFKGFAFFLTHDVDRVSYYNFNNLLLITKQISGSFKSDKNRSRLFGDFFHIAFNLLIRGKDPFWNFRKLSEDEKKLGIRSTWFFLPKDQKHQDSYYQLNDSKIKNLILYLLKEGHEIGLHGTLRSHLAGTALKEIMNNLFSVSGQKKTGIRQHRLMWSHPLTALIQEKEGIIYDSTLGFAGHEGFRNSYCHPFRLFDFENNRMLSSWEIPLNVMDGTLIEYRKLRFSESIKSIEGIIEEVSRFNGVFTLLWHNHVVYDREWPGYPEFYANLLKSIMARKPESLKGMEIAERMK